MKDAAHTGQVMQRAGGVYRRGGEERCRHIGSQHVAQNARTICRAHLALGALESVKREQRPYKASRLRRRRHPGVFPALQAGNVRARLGTILYCKVRMRTLKPL
jgi:hypothetical protein